MTAPRTRPDDFEALEGMARTLTASGWYRVVRRFEPRQCYGTTSGETRTALFVDVETTGLTAATDRIIEFAAVPFTYAVETGEVCDVEKGYCGLEDPGMAIPPAVTELTGITDEMVAGTTLDEDAVEHLLSSAALVIAHKASFDRPFLERRLPRFAEKYWACSCTEIPWSAHGCRQATLEYLLFHHCGEFFAAHRALEDCRVGVHVLATRLASGALPMALLLSSARARTARIWATGAHFDVKDKLKARRYRFHPGGSGRTKVWYRDVPEADVIAECAWLEAVIYPGTTPTYDIEWMTAKSRYSDRGVGPS